MAHDKILNMIERFSSSSLTWISLKAPTSDEVREVMEEANLPPELMNDLTGPVPRSSSVALSGTVKVTFDYPIVKRTDINHPHEIKLIATKKHLITVYYEDVEALHRFQKEFETIALLNNTRKRTTGFHLLTSVMSFLYTALGSKLDYLDSKLADIETEIFKEREKEMVGVISDISRRIITFKHVIATHERVLSELKSALEAVSAKQHVIAANELIDQFEFVTSRIKSTHEALTELRETNMALLTTKQNEIMKVFTILAFITFPLTLFTSMFGMNTTTTPILGQKGDFWIILGSMVVVSIVFFAYFKYKKWI